MLRAVLHPGILLLILLAVACLWWWAKRVNLRMRLTRLPTQKEWAILSLALQALRWILRIRI